MPIGAGVTKVTFKHVDPEGAFSFHKADGSLVEITADKPYATGDPSEVAYLDTVRFVKRASGKGA